MAGDAIVLSIIQDEVVVKSFGGTGARGLTGTAGADGTDGSNGTNGNIIRSGSGVPSDAVGNDGDLYIRTSNGNLYQRAAGVYAIISNIIGPSGTNGTNGTNGATGATGLGYDTAQPIVTKTADYTLALTEIGKLVEGNKASTITFTIPLNSAVAFPIGVRIDMVQFGVGQLVVAGSGGVTIHSTPGLKARAQYSGMTAEKRDTDEWYLFGDLSA